MEFPNSSAVEVSREKVVEYLLNPEHPDGAGKATFFLTAGFCVERWEEFADAMKQLVERATAARSVDSPHGSKYIVEGEINTPSGRMAFVRTVWIIDHGQLNARLVTAYPARQES
jgi:hypothetical protein